MKKAPLLRKVMVDMITGSLEDGLNEQVMNKKRLTFIDLDRIDVIKNDI
ncbi:hypothetical protein [Priestia megaterium]|nr:hypothetical protein [Priestia megaterium]MCM3187080.1 hypothetical protein [Priestia megaterium]